jgi:hypothetical protein
LTRTRVISSHSVSSLNKRCIVLAFNLKMAFAIRSWFAARLL